MGVLEWDCDCDGGCWLFCELELEEGLAAGCCCCWAEPACRVCRVEFVSGWKITLGAGASLRPRDARAELGVSTVLRSLLGVPSSPESSLSPFKLLEVKFSRVLVRSDPPLAVVNSRISGGGGSLLWTVLIS